MTTHATPDINSALKTFSQQTASQLGVDEKVLNKLEQLENNHRIEGVKQVAVSTDIHVPVQQGHGSYVSQKYPTFWMNVQGTAKITAPSDGTTWTVVVTDIVQNKTIFSGSNIKMGQQIPFSYKTGFTCQVKAEAQCGSTSENTTLVIHLDVE